VLITVGRRLDELQKLDSVLRKLGFVFLACLVLFMYKKYGIIPMSQCTCTIGTIVPGASAFLTSPLVSNHGLLLQLVVICECRIIQAFLFDTGFSRTVPLSSRDLGVKFKLLLNPVELYVQDVFFSLKTMQNLPLGQLYHRQSAGHNHLVSLPSSESFIWGSP